MMNDSGWRFRARVLVILIAGLACSAGSSTLVLPEGVSHALARQTEAFVQADGFAVVELDQGFWDQRYYTQTRFLELSSAQLSLPDAQLRPITKAILLLEAYEGVLPRVRYQIDYLRAPSPSEDWSLDIAHVQITRFNLGPALRDEVIASYGAENAAAPEEFGVGPHVRWRIEFQPVMGQLADVTAASRRVLTAAEAASVDCMGTACLSLDQAWGPEDSWQALSGVATVEVISSSPAAVAADALSHALQGEAPYGEMQGEAGGDPQLVLVISQGVDGQGPPLVVVGHVPNAMDDAIRQYWVRRIQFGPNVDWEQRTEYRPGRQ